MAHASTKAVRSRRCLARFPTPRTSLRRRERPKVERKVRATAVQHSETSSEFGTTAKKALSINLEPTKYGTLAEIGAGQEVARWFFRVGGAAGTVAKSISAYDMTISDTVYGACDRYVTQERLEAMLEYEYLQCTLPLKNARGENTAFFSFADTVVAKAYGRQNECHGWMGLKYQISPGKPPSRIMLHVRMMDPTAEQQQEALGVLGVNLLYGAFNLWDSPQDLLLGLMDNLSRDSIEIDLIRFDGPAFKDVDDRVMALRLVEYNFTEACLFNSDGEVVIPSEVMRKKNVLVQRGRFRPFTNIHNDMIVGAASQFFCGDVDESDSCVLREDTVVLLEMTTKDMYESGDMLDWTSKNGVNDQEFLKRADALQSLGHTILISNFTRYWEIASFLTRSTKESIVITLGVPAVKELFKEYYYQDMDGGILENFGRLLKFDLKLYVYPTLDERGNLITAEDVKVDPEVQLLYDFLYQRGCIVPITMYDPAVLSSRSASQIVLDSIRNGTEDWERYVPEAVAKQIKKDHLLGYRPPKSKSNGNVSGASSANRASVVPRA
uniref:Nicotinate-nucleotide adenylyltransferase n=1 Tax=Picocystis salinarum TaxID=88271 RepID=A0A7S3XDH2_9CHLO|mmetsp:Transcript_10234/g.62485  ORF Transcript_10234/g.62485 Transcript_10234/m.62485 type:complete len:553 (-) Transcript_10234:2596-4254(-)